MAPSETMLSGSYDYRLVVLSVVIATFASYAALDLAGRVTVARDAANGDIEAAVLNHEAVQKALDGKTPKKVIIVPHRIVNVVA